MNDPKIIAIIDAITNRRSKQPKKSPIDEKLAKKINQLVAYIKENY